MMFQQDGLLLCLLLIPLIAAAEPARLHEARQGPITTPSLSEGPGPVSQQTSSSSSTPKASTMSSTTSASETSKTASPTSSGSPSQPSSSSSIIISAQNMTTCTSGLISWTYSGPEAGLSLSIINYTASQNTDDSTALQLVVTNTSAKNYKWPSVNVTQGWYKIQGVSTVTNDSTPFFVSNGTDVACLTGPSSSNASPTPSPATLTVSHTNVAGMVGGIVAGIIALVLLALAVLIWRRRKGRFSSVGDCGGKTRKWGSLKSTSSSIPDGDAARATSKHLRAHSGSTGAIIIQDDAGGRVFATPGASDEDVATTGEEKLVSSTPSSTGISPFDALNTPLHHDRRASMYSVQTPTTVVSPEGPWSRSGSRCISNQSLEQQAQRIRSSMESSNRRRSERLSMPTVPSPNLARIPPSPTVTQAKEEYALSPVTPTAVNRSVSTGAVSMTTRRASRKPVPHYDPALLLEDTNADSVSTFTAGAESSQSHGTGALSGTHGTASESSAHEANFADGRPVHYLIPDMPPPQQD